MKRYLKVNIVPSYVEAIVSINGINRTTALIEEGEQVLITATATDYEDFSYSFIMPNIDTGYIVNLVEKEKGGDIPADTLTYSDSAIKVNNNPIQIDNENNTILNLDVNSFKDGIVQTQLRDKNTATNNNLVSELAVATAFSEVGDDYTYLETNKQDKLTSNYYVLSSSNWDSSTKKQTISIDGLTTDSVVWVGPKSSENGEDEKAYSENNVRAISQQLGEIVFICNTIPSKDINIIITF